VGCRHVALTLVTVLPHANFCAFLLANYRGGAPPAHCSLGPAKVTCEKYFQHEFRAECKSDAKFNRTRIQWAISKLVLPPVFSVHFVQ
jgi:hypothetical protein